MKIIIVGCGKVGQTLTKQLSEEKHDVTVIDTNPTKISDITNAYDVMGYIGNGASYSVQKEAGIDSSDLLIAVTPSDELNLLCCLIAKKAGNVNTIARVRDPLYSKEIGYIKDELGLSLTVNPEQAAANEIAAILRFPSANHIERFAKGKVEILSFKLEEGSPLVGKTLIDVGKTYKTETLICAVQRGENVFIPNGAFILREEDLVSIIASPMAAKEFFTKIGYDTKQVKDTMIVGGGGIAYYLAQQLLRMGIRVKIVEKDPDRCEHLSEHLPKATIICGDASNQDVLLEEGIKDCSSFVSLTGIDEANIFLSLFAKSNTKGKIVTKINHIGFDDIISTFNLGTICAPKDITSQRIVSYVRAMQNSIGSNVKTLYKIMEEKVEALEFVINEGAPVIGIPLKDITLKQNILLGCITRGGNIIIPNGMSEIQAGDSVIVITTQKGLKDIGDILKE